MSGFSAHQAEAVACIDDQRRRFSDFNKTIWNFAEPAWREYKSVARLLRAAARRGLCGRGRLGRHADRLRRDLGQRRRPCWAATPNTTRCPGQSQQVVPLQGAARGAASVDRRPYRSAFVARHGGARRHAGDQGGDAAARHLRGTLKFFGEPAEKVCGSKPVHAAKGYYDGCDAFIAYHPHATNTVQGETQCGAYWSVVITFETLHPRHGSTSRCCRSALRRMPWRAAPARSTRCA